MRSGILALLGLASLGAGIAGQLAVVAIARTVTPTTSSAVFASGLALALGGAIAACALGGASIRLARRAQRSVVPGVLVCALGALVVLAWCAAGALVWAVGVSLSGHGGLV